MDGQGTDLLRILAVLGAGLAAGFVNTVAGGGSLLTLPALIFLGLPAPVANATNRVGILLQNVVASGTFHRQGMLPAGTGARLLLTAIPGAALGAVLAVDIDETLFRRLLGAIMLLVLMAILRQGKRPRGGGIVRPVRRPLWLYAGYFLIGVYAGFIQAGVGFLIIAALTALGGLDLVRANAVKVFTILFIQVVAVGIFAFSGLVHWTWGLTLAAGTMIGGWIGVRWQLKSGEAWVRRILVVAITVFALKLLV